MSNQYNDIYYENFMEYCQECSLEELEALLQDDSTDEIKEQIIKNTIEVIKQEQDNH